MKKVILAFVLFNWMLLAVPSVDERLRHVEISIAEFRAEFRESLKGVNQRISDLYSVVVALIVGLFGFTGYIAYDRKKFNEKLLEIQNGVTLQKVDIEKNQN